VFWVDLISKIREALGEEPSAFPTPMSCGNVMPLWQMVLVYDDRQLEEILQICPYAEGRSIQRIASNNRTLYPRYNTTEIYPMIQEIYKSIELIHKCGYMHRDLTPTNILFSRVVAKETPYSIVDILGKGWVPVIADMESLLPLNIFDQQGGLAWGWSGGTRGFSTPPEAYKSPKSVVGGKKFGLAWDLWGLGAICYSLLWGVPPFIGDTVQEVDDNIQNASYIIPPAKKIPLQDWCRCIGSLDSEAINALANSNLLQKPLHMAQLARQVCDRCEKDVEALESSCVQKLLTINEECRLSWKVLKPLTSKSL